MKDTKEFAMEMFEALTRRKGLKVESLSKDELYDMWLQVTDQSFDCRMQIFFDLCDKNGDGRITEEEVKEVLMLSAAANKLSRLKEQAEEYAALIMEELDPTDQGYIEVGCWLLQLMHESRQPRPGGNPQASQQAMLFVLESSVRPSVRPQMR